MSIQPPPKAFLPAINTVGGASITSNFNNASLSKSYSVDPLGLTQMTKNKIPRFFKNQKSLKYLSNNSPIEITPSEIIFRDITVNQMYEISVFVRNLTKIVRRIRIFQPQTSKFRCDYEMSGAIAAGLAMKLTVSFETAVLGEFKDVLKIVSDENTTIEVPLLAVPVQSQILFEPFLNFGFVKIGQEKSELIRFKNEGKINGKIEIKYDKVQDVIVDPHFFTLLPGSEGTIRVSYK